jgi:hypothetical protein
MERSDRSSSRQREGKGYLGSVRYLSLVPLFTDSINLSKVFEDTRLVISEAVVVIQSKGSSGEGIRRCHCLHRFDNS